MGDQLIATWVEGRHSSHFEPITHKLRKGKEDINNDNNYDNDNNDNDNDNNHSDDDDDNDNNDDYDNNDNKA